MNTPVSIPIANSGEDPFAPTRSVVCPSTRRGFSLRSHRRWLLAGLVSLVLPFTLAPLVQAKEGGTVIQGRVLDASNGQYLKNARIAIEGSTLTALTNDYGEYQVTGVPVGLVKLRVSYPGLPPQQLTVTTATGQTVQRDVEFTAAGPSPGETVLMDAFTVAARRETDGKTIAINEQRYAGEIKNVVASDEYGDVTEGNVGEFLKYIPGVLVDYNAAAARTISVRGLPPSTTPVSMDGNRMATAASSSASRTFEFEQVSINNTSRVEVSKSATPDRPADTLGGSINMISKSAFERAKALFSYRAFLSVNDTATSMGKAAIGPDGSREHLTKPGFDFTYINPVNKNFGFVVTGLFSSNYNPQTLSQTNWYPISGSVPSGSPATVTAVTPYMGSYRLQTSPQTTQRGSLGLTVDWRMTPRDVLSVKGQYNSFDNYFYIENCTFDTALVDAFGPTFTNGAANRGNLYTSTNFRHKVGSTWQPNVSYRHTGENWTIDAGGYYSQARNRYRDIDDGFFNGVTAGVTTATVNFGNITADRPGTITVIKNGVTIDPFNLSNLQVITTPTSVNNSGYQGQINSNQSKAADTMRGAHADFKRDLGPRLPVMLKFGVDYRQNVRDIRVTAPVWRYNGGDGVYTSGDEPAAPFINSSFSATEPPYGFSSIQWLDPRKMYQLYQAHPEQFVEQFTGAYGTIQRATNGSQYIDESVSSGYLRADVRLFGERLLLVAGVRRERTEDAGQGVLKDTNAIYQRDASGKLVRDASGRTILLTADTTAQTRLQYIDRGSQVARSYDGYYPSANATFKISDNFVARASYARTIGRPDFTSIIPSIVLPDLSSTSLLITVNNSGLKPWQANNYDLSLEYYFKQAGVVSVGAFRKDFSNFFGSVTLPATPELLAQFDLDPALFQGYSLVTKTNIGDAQVTGLEFNYSQQLTFLPHIARGVSVFANATALHLSGPTTADFSAFVSRNANWGVSVNRQRYTMMLKWVYRTDQRLLARTGTGVPTGDFQWLKGSLKLDVNAEYRLSKSLALFVNARNITNEPYVLEYHSETTPAYARQYNTQDFGVQYALGLKGSF
jgi:TonB-dependent receptor